MVVVVVVVVVVLFCFVLCCVCGSEFMLCEVVFELWFVNVVLRCVGSCTY